MTSAVQVIARRPAAPDDDDETSDVTIQKLKLVGALKKGGIDIDVTRVITDGHVEDSTTGAPQFTIQILDRGLAALNSGVFGQTVDVELDRVPWRLVEVNLTDSAAETLELPFEHKLVNVLRQFKTPLKAARSSVNRAQFFEIMLREAAPAFGPIRFVCPEINQIQPIAGASASGRTLTSTTLSSKTIGRVVGSVRGSGFGVTSLDIQDWDGSTAVLGPSQLANAAIVLQVCNQFKAGAKATLAVMAACIVEPNQPFENTAGGGGGSSGILQWVNKPFANDVAQSVTNALLDPGATGKGGMISLARANPGWSPGQIAQAEQGSAFGSRYDRAVPGAQAVIKAFTSAGGFAATGVSFGAAAGVSTYEFSRGQPGQSEDSWTCMQRLAKEVNWRCFVAGRNSLYFVTDDDLLNAPPAYALGPSTPGMTRLSFQVEVGGRTVRIHRRRQPKPSEGELTVRIDRWAAVPGGVVTLDGYGPADARWLIVDTTRPLFDTEATVRIQSPQSPLPEPSASSTTAGTAAGGTGGSLISGNVVDRVYAAARAMDGMFLPYSQATRTLSNPPPPGGYDCSASTSWALLTGGLPLPGGITWGGWAPVSGDFETWGQAGPGAAMTVWCSPTHVFIQFTGYPAQRFDTVPGGSGGSGPHLRYTAPVESGMTSRHWPGT